MYRHAELSAPTRSPCIFRLMAGENFMRVATTTAQAAFGRGDPAAQTAAALAGWWPACVWRWQRNAWAASHCSEGREERVEVP